MLDNAKLAKAFAELATPLVADACVRLRLPLRLAPPGISALPARARVAGRALPAWQARLAPPAAGDEAPLEIHVAAEQFAWQIHYPGPDGRFGRTDATRITESNHVGIAEDHVFPAEDFVAESRSD